MDFKEEQRLNSKFAIIIFFAAMLVTLTGMVSGSASMIAAGESFYSMIWFMLAFVVIIGIVFLMMFRLELETEVDRNGFSFRYFPFIRNKKILDFNDMESWELKSKKNWAERMTFGYKNNRFRKQTSFMMGGNDYIEIKTGRGNIYWFSTHEAYALSSSMRKYCSEKEIVNGQRK